LEQTADVVLQYPLEESAGLDSENQGGATVKGKPSVWRSTSARVIALGVVLVLTPLPAAAAETSPPTKPSIDFNAAVLKFAATARPAPARHAGAQPPRSAGRESAADSPSFFRTPLGVAVIAIVGAGTAYALYSANHDRIHSATR
jgi:hypothetical protein